MKKEVAVSIIIPFYSHKDWLLESLESVFSQTFKDFEVILINDGSQEDISDIINTYGDKIVYLTQVNQGPAAARNYGISIAKGKYIAFEDSDDLWLPNKLEKQIGFMESCGAEWSHTGFYYWWPNNNKLSIVDVTREYGDIYMQRFISVKMATPCVVIRRDLLEKERLSFPVEYRNGEDGVLFTKIAQNHPVALVEEPLAKIRMRGVNSNSHAIERFRLGALQYKKMCANRKSFPSMMIFIKSIYYIYSKLFNGRITKKNEFFAKCLWTIPFGLERIYVRYLAKHANKDKKYYLPVQ